MIIVDVEFIYLMNMGLRYRGLKDVVKYRQEEPPLSNLAAPCHLEESASHHSSYLSSRELIPTTGFRADINQMWSAHTFVRTGRLAHTLLTGITLRQYRDLLYELRSYRHDDHRKSNLMIIVRICLSPVLLSGSTETCSTSYYSTS